MSIGPLDEPHVYTERPGTDWCRQCGGGPLAVIHALEGMVYTPTGWVYPVPLEVGGETRPMVTKDWAGLLEILDHLYPIDVFPTLPDDHDRDLGPRIISLCRRVHDLENELFKIKQGE